MDETMSPADTPVTPRSVADLRELVGRELGPSAWYEVTQERIDEFATLTEDRQWIHVDVERATRELGAPIAHGLFTASLGPKFMEEMFSFDGFAKSLNYGYDRVRFPAPLPSGSRVRMRGTITDVADVPGGAQISMDQIFELEEGGKPVCVAAFLARFYE